MPGIKAKIARAISKQFLHYAFLEGVRERMGRQDFFYNAFQALTYNGIAGDYTEFGCHGGMTFTLAYKESRRHGHEAKLWAFDSFQGLPPATGAKDDHPVWVEGTMGTSLERFRAICASNGIPEGAYEAIPGFYDMTLTARTAPAAPRDIALAYIDCDLYTSTKTVLEFLKPRLKHGMILAFDDYFCWSASQASGERMAMLEMSSECSEWELVPYMQFGWHGQSFVVESATLTNHIKRNPRLKQ